MKVSRIDSAFERALAGEILASERMRVAVLAGALGLLRIGEQTVFFTPIRGTLQQFAQTPLPTWLPLWAIGPFLAYEIIVYGILSYRGAHGLDMPRPARFANVLIETSLPTALIWWRFTASRSGCPRCCWSAKQG